MAITGKPRALSWTALAEKDIEILPELKEDLSADIRLRNHEQRIAANKEGLDTVNKKVSSTAGSLDSAVDTAGEKINGVYSSVDTIFDGITGKDRPDDYDDIREQLSALKEDIESAASVVEQYRSFGFDAAVWRERRTQLLELEAEISSAPTSYNGVAYTNIGLLTEDTVDRNFDLRIIGGTFAAIKGNLRCKTGDNPFTGWWFYWQGNGYGMICNLYTLDVLSVSKKGYEGHVKFRTIFKNGAAALSDQELFPDEKILIDALMAEGLTAELWYKTVFDISRLYYCLNLTELLKAAGLNSAAWNTLLLDLERLKAVDDVCFDKLSVKNWKRVVRALLGQETDISEEESRLVRSLVTAGFNRKTWSDLLVAMEDLKTMISWTNSLKSAGLDIKGWEELLDAIEQAKTMAAFVELVKKAGFKQSSWSLVQKVLANEENY